MIPDEMKSLDRWVCVCNNSKIPMQARTNRAASPSDPDTWSDYRTAKSAVDAGTYDGLGFVLGAGIVGIDIDNGYDDYGILSKMAADVMVEAWSYTERSRSGRGFHIYLKGDLPFNGRNNRNGCEIYKTGRFFIVTGNTVLPKFFPQELTENQAGIDEIIKKYFPEPVNTYGGRMRQYEPIYLPPEGNIIPVRPHYPPVLEGCRNQSLTSLAGQLHMQGYPAREIFHELMHVNTEACDPPLKRREVINIVSSVIRYERC